jgi:hypothetical protein
METKMEKKEGRNKKENIGKRCREVSYFVFFTVN